MINKKQGISLIVLVITIIVIIILAGAIILSLSANNPIASANKATCLSDVANFKAAVALDFATEVSVYMSGTITYTPDPSVVTLQNKLLTKYGLTSVVSNVGEITFSGGGTLPDGVGIVAGDVVSVP